MPLVGKADSGCFVETSMPGVFAVGDVRRGATKRASSAVGSEAIAIQLVHEYFAGQGNEG